MLEGAESKAPFLAPHPSDDASLRAEEIRRPFPATQDAIGTLFVFGPAIQAFTGSDRILRERFEADCNLHSCPQKSAP